MRVQFLQSQDSKVTYVIFLDLMLVRIQSHGHIQLQRGVGKVVSGWVSMCSANAWQEEFYHFTKRRKGRKGIG